MSDPDFADIAAYITAESVCDLLIDLVNIPSTTGKEIGVAQYLVERMRKSGMETDLPLVEENRPNAVGHWRGRGDGLNLLFTGHMDTSYSGEEEHLAGDGFKPKAIGGAMVGLQATAIKTQLGPLLNGWTNYDFWLPVPKMEFAGVADLIKRYQGKAAAEGVDPLGYYMAPWGYAQLQVLQQAVESTKSLDDGKLGDYIRANTFKTVVGDVKFGAKGEWEKSRVLQVQFQNVKGNDVAQFKDMSTQVVVAPAEYESGKVIYPYEKAK